MSIENDLDWTEKEVILIKIQWEEHGVPIGTMWKRPYYMEKHLKQWRRAVGLELELYYHGIRHIPDLSKY